MDKNDILRAAKSGKSAEDILKGLNDTDRAAVQRILNDRSATERLLASDEAKALFRILFGDGKNG